jgi:hypothetical protein
MAEAAGAAGDEESTRGSKEGSPAAKAADSTGSMSGSRLIADSHLGGDSHKDAIDERDAGMSSSAVTGYGAAGGELPDVGGKRLDCWRDNGAASAGGASSDGFNSEKRGSWDGLTTNGRPGMAEERGEVSESDE